MSSKTKIRILITGPVLTDPGGVANYYAAVLPHLNANDEIELKYLEIGKRASRNLFSRMVGDQLRVDRAIRDFQPDIVHVNPSLNPKSFFRDAFFTLAAKRRGTRALVFYRGWNDEFAVQVDRWLRTFFRLTFGRADGFLVLAENARSLIRQWGAQQNITLETTVVPDSLVESFSLEEKLCNLKKQTTTRILFMARLEAEKGVHETIDAILEMARSGHSVSLTIAGDGGAMEAVRDQLRKDNDARRYVEVVGYAKSEAKRELLRSHHIYCLPSYHGEGMPNAMLEAMAFGMPIVTCLAGGIADMFRDGYMGEVVEPRSSHAIAQAITNLVDSWSNFSTIAKYNHEFATQNALASQAASRLCDIYRELGKQDSL